ncbi:hypothetical protein ACH5RR_025816 [Cinchona calisaya]|uniref:AIG1-type G domain-containing protein n=1 Tax=Cinchona calisaya TaxID=153742 RepID=A0ABD2Z318_9GENT
MDSNEAAASSALLSGSSPLSNDNINDFEIDTDSSSISSNGKINSSILSPFEADPDEQSGEKGSSRENAGGPFGADENRSVSDALVDDDDRKNSNKVGELGGVDGYENELGENSEGPFVADVNRDVSEVLVDDDNGGKINNKVGELGSVDGDESELGENSDGPIVGDENRVVSEVIVDGDNGKKIGNQVGELEVEKDVDGDESEVGKESNAVGDSFVDNSNETVVVQEVERKLEVPEFAGNLNGSGGENERGTIQGLGESSGDKGVQISGVVESESSVKDEELIGPVDVIDAAPEVKDVVREVDDRESGALSNYDGGTVGEEEKPVDGDGLKVMPEGDSVVEAINVQVNVAESGVSVVGETAENDTVKVQETWTTIHEDVMLDGDKPRSDIGADNGGMTLIREDDPSSEATIGQSIEKEEPKPLQLATPVEVVYGEKSDRATENGPQTVDKKNIHRMHEAEIELLDASKAKENGTAANYRNDEKVLSRDENQAGYSVNEEAYGIIQHDVLKENDSGMPEYTESQSVNDAKEMVEAEDEAKIPVEEEADLEGLISEGGENNGMIFGSSEAAKQFIQELERGSGGDSFSGADSSRGHPQRIDGQIVTDSDEVDTDEEGEGKELFDSAALAALLKAATGADLDGGSIKITSQDGSSLFSVERPAGLGTSLRSLRPTPQPNRPNIFSTSISSNSGDSESNLTNEEKNKLERLQQIRVKFLRLLHRLGLSVDESVAAQVLYRLNIVAGRQRSQLFSIEAAKEMALQLEAKENVDLDFSLNILVLGKSGVGKSATINSIFGEEKAHIDAFQPATTTVKEISGFVDGVKLRVFDTPGLKCSAMEQSFNRSILSSLKKLTKKSPPDIVLYVDRLDAQTRDLNDLPLLRTITSSLGPSIWRSAIVTLTHGASAPPDGPSGSPLSYEIFVTQRSHVVQQSIGQAVGDLRMMSPSLMNPVSLVENHPSCRKTREGQKVLPNGQNWRPQLLLLCYSMKILSEASSVSKPQDPFDQRKLFGFRSRSPPLPYMLSSMLQFRAHPKLSTEQGGENGDSDIDLDDLSDMENDEEDEYDQLPPFRSLRKAQIAKLSKEQRKAYFEEYDYRVKLLQKKQWKEELKRMREMKTKGKDADNDNGFHEEDADSGAAAAVAVPLPDMVLPPSFDGDNPAYRYRFLEPTSQFFARPVLDTHGWDHDCGYEGVNIEHNLAILNRFPAAVTVQITKDKKDFTISLDSAISAKHGENGSSMAGFDIQSIGKQLAYVVRGETKFKNLKNNKTAGGISITFLGENVVPGVKIEDQVSLGKQYALVGSAGAVRAQQDMAYGANFELQRREQDFPIGQVQSTFSLSVIKWRGDLALGFNSLAQFSVGRGSKVAVRAGINNKLSGQISIRTSSSEHLSLALAAVVPTVISIYKKLYPAVGEKHLMY